MVDEVLTNTVGLIVGFGVAQSLGDYIESKIKPGIVTTSTSQDKMIAEAANDGSKIALAYGAYTAGKTSDFAKSVAVGSVLSTMFDVYWRYKHEGVPYSGYKTVPIETPVGTPVETPTTPVGTPTTPVGTPTTPVTPVGTDTGTGTDIGAPDIGLLDTLDTYNSFLISDTDTLEIIMSKGRILEEI